MHFAVEAIEPASGARAGVLRTPHGAVPTPAFMPVGTQATVKGLTPEELRAAGSRMVLANTYHLWLRPGEDVVAAAGGLHRFMHWDGPVLTDSGGFQVFSLADRRTVDDAGVTFRSHLDGSLRRLTPEVAVRVQEALGSDVAMCLDECTGYPATRSVAEQAAERTLLWARRCREAHVRADQALFGIVQGATYPDLRRACAADLVALDLPGYALGSLSVGESPAELAAVLDVTVPLLPADRPRYLMGVGTPDLIIEAVWRGVDLFDCVWPTRLARHGAALLGSGLRRLSLRAAAYARDFGPLDPDCACEACRSYSRAYLHHLFRARETLGARLVTVHNLNVLHGFLARVRAAVGSGDLAALRAAIRAETQALAACGPNGKPHRRDASGQGRSAAT